MLYRVISILEPFKTIVLEIRVTVYLGKREEMLAWCEAEKGFLGIWGLMIMDVFILGWFSVPHMSILCSM